MLQRAMEKLEKEIAAEKDDEFISYIGSFMMDHVRQHPQDAVLVLADNKTVKGSFKAMEDEANKKKENNRAAFTLVQGQAIILKYYGIKSNEPVAALAASNFNVSLDDIF